MQEATGNIWSWRDKGAKVVVPTNIGWTKDGLNVMGAGLAKQAARMYPDLPRWYGDLCRERGALTSVVEHPQHPLILFPVKPLDRVSPHLSWQQGADPWLIEGSLMELAELPGAFPIAVPLVGCGNGGLDEKIIYPLLKLYLTNDRFTLVRFGQPGVVRLPKR